MCWALILMKRRALWSPQSSFSWLCSISGVSFVVCLVVFTGWGGWDIPEGFSTEKSKSPDPPATPYSGTASIRFAYFLFFLCISSLNFIGLKGAHLFCILRELNFVFFMHLYESCVNSFLLSRHCHLLPPACSLWFDLPPPSSFSSHSQARPASAMWRSPCLTCLFFFFAAASSSNSRSDATCSS